MQGHICCLPNENCIFKMTQVVPQLVKHIVSQKQVIAMCRSR